MAATQISRLGFGQVEPNHLSAQQTGQIYAQLPASTAFNILENGMFLKYDYENEECNLTGTGEWMLVMNEIKLYDPRAFRYKDYAMQKSDFMDGELVPRLLKTNIGDLYTTNTFGANTSPSSTVAGLSLDLGDTLTVDPSTGYLTAATTADEEFIWSVAKVYTMPDGQPGVKLRRIK